MPWRDMPQRPILRLKQNEMLMEPLAIALGTRVRSVRKSAGLSQEEFAYRAGVDRSYVGKIERGEVNITVNKLYRLARVLDCAPHDLLPGIREVAPSGTSGAPRF